MHGALGAAVSAVADDEARFAVPLEEEKVERILQDGRHRPIVLRRDEDKRRVLLNLSAPSFGVFVGVVFGLVGVDRWEGFIKEGKVPLGQVDELSFKLAGSRQVPLLKVLESKSRDLWVHARLT